MQGTHTKREKNPLKTEIIDAILEQGQKMYSQVGDDFSRDDFHKLKNKIYGKYQLPKPIANIELIERYNELCASGEAEENLGFKKLLRKR